MAKGKVKMECLECGKKFSVSPNNPDPRCPKCHGVDLDVDDGMLFLKTAHNSLSQADGYAGDWRAR